jgi:hypothetical protein
VSVWQSENSTTETPTQQQLREFRTACENRQNEIYFAIPYYEAIDYNPTAVPIRHTDDGKVYLMKLPEVNPMDHFYKMYHHLPELKDFVATPEEAYRFILWREMAFMQYGLSKIGPNRATNVAIAEREAMNKVKSWAWRTRRATPSQNTTTQNTTTQSQPSNNRGQWTTVGDKQVRITSIGYRKGDPQSHPDAAYIFTENAQADAATHGLDDSWIEEGYQKGSEVKLEVSDMNGSNQAGIRAVKVRGQVMITPNAFGIVVKKYQQKKGQVSFLQEEGQFQNTPEDKALFIAANLAMFKRLEASGLKKIVFPGQIAMGKAALPRDFADWLQGELRTRFGIVTEIKENTRKGYKGFGLVLQSINGSPTQQTQQTTQSSQATQTVSTSPTLLPVTAESLLNNAQVRVQQAKLLHKEEITDASVLTDRGIQIAFAVSKYPHINGVITFNNKTNKWRVSFYKKKEASWNDVTSEEDELTKTSPNEETQQKIVDRYIPKDLQEYYTSGQQREGDKQAINFYNILEAENPESTVGDRVAIWGTTTRGIGIGDNVLRDRWGIYSINEYTDDINFLKSQGTSTTITESTGGYPQRTRENAEWSDITLAFAVDFNTAGEKLTKKVAGNKYHAFSIAHIRGTSQLNNPQYITAGQSDARRWAKTQKIKERFPKGLKINIAGNGIYTLLPQNISQEDVNDYLEGFFQGLRQEGVIISEVRSGGQTGIDEAGIIAAQRLGIPSSVHAPKGFTFRQADGRDISNRPAFERRFRPQSQQAQQSAGSTASQTQPQSQATTTQGGSSIDEEFPTDNKNVRRTLSIEEAKAAAQRDSSLLETPQLSSIPQQETEDVHKMPQIGTEVLNVDPDNPVARLARDFTAMQRHDRATMLAKNFSLIVDQKVEEQVQENKEAIIAEMNK